MVFLEWFREQAQRAAGGIGIAPSPHIGIPARAIIGG
jgi:hypothetical protein